MFMANVKQKSNKSQQNFNQINRKYLTITEVAKIINVHRSTVHKHILAGKLTSTWIDNMWYIRPDDVQKIYFEKL